jgi:hypothetical protein
MKNQNRTLKQGKSAPRSRQTKKAPLPCVLSSEMQSEFDWPHIIKPLAKRILEVEKLLGVIHHRGQLVNAAVAAYIYLADGDIDSFRRHPGMIDDENYRWAAQNKFSGMRVTGLAERFNWLAIKMGTHAGYLLPLAVRRFLDYAAVNQCEASDTVFMVNELLDCHDPAPGMDKIEVSLPDWIFQWINEDKRPGTTEAGFIADVVREAVLSKRGYLDKKAA